MDRLNRVPVGYWLIAIVFAFFGGVVADDLKLDGLKLPNIVAPILTPAPEKATAATYVYEKGETAVPPQVNAALDKLNRERGIIATALDADIKDGTGNEPEQYLVALAAAREAGTPCLVVTAGAKVLRVVKNPKDEASVLEAVK